VPNRGSSAGTSSAYLAKAVTELEAVVGSFALCTDISLLHSTLKRFNMHSWAMFAKCPHDDAWLEEDAKNSPQAHPIALPSIANSEKIMLKLKDAHIALPGKVVTQEHGFKDVPKFGVMPLKVM
jgi:hypothetical protein